MAEAHRSGWTKAPHIDEGEIVGPGRELTVDFGPPPLVRLADDVAVAPDAVVALVERCYRHDGIERYCTDLHVAHVRTPIMLDGVRLDAALEKLAGHGD